MNNIEKLAIERKAFESLISPLLPNNSSMYDPLAKYTTDEFNGQYVDGDVQKAWVKFQAYASSLQSSEPATCKYGNEPKSCTSNPMDCQCALDATLQSSEPVGEITMSAVYPEENGKYIHEFECDERLPVGAELFTNPPASVSLEKYNKLLERLEWVEQSLNEATESIKMDVLQIISEYPSRVKKRTAIKLDASYKSIAEAEGKEG